MAHGLHSFVVSINDVSGRDAQCEVFQVAAAFWVFPVANGNGGMNGTGLSKQYRSVCFSNESQEVKNVNSNTY